MNKNKKCPVCNGPLASRYQCDRDGEVLGKDYWCTSCPWAAVGNW